MPRVLYAPIGVAVPGAVYIGGPSRWGSPFVLGRDGDRNQVATKYCCWLLCSPQLVEAATRELKGRDLVCGPDHCHGEILLDVANRRPSNPYLDEHGTYVADLLHRVGYACPDCGTRHPAGGGAGAMCSKCFIEEEPLWMGQKAAVINQPFPSLDEALARFGDVLNSRSSRPAICEKRETGQYWVCHQKPAQSMGQAV